MDSKETNEEQEHPPHGTPLKGSYNRNAATSTSQHPLMVNDGSPHSVAPQQLGNEQKGRPDVVDVDGNANSSGPKPAKRRGRTPGSKNKQRKLGSLTSHVIDVNAGEDIAVAVVAFLNQEPRDVCILSASGSVSRALLQSNTPLGVASYEGLYHIASMSGQFVNTEIDGTVTRTGNLKVSMAGPDCRVIGGSVAGMLVAGSQSQVVVGTYGQEKLNLSAGRVENKPEPASAPANVSLSGGGLGTPQASEENDTRFFVWRPVLPRNLWPGNNPQ